MAERRNRKPAEIYALVEAHRSRTYNLRKRYEEDYALYRLEPFGEGADGDDYEHYTSSGPRSFADKIKSWITSASVLIRIRHSQNTNNPVMGGAPGAAPVMADRKEDNNAERFFIGVLKSVDERLLNQGLPPLKEQLAFYSSVRGGPVCGRAMLRKRKNGDGETETFADILPFDPLHASWEFGEDGLEWFCYAIDRPVSWINATYGKELRRNGSLLASEGLDSDDMVKVYDFYDRRDNKVVTEDRVLKRATEHGSPRVPVVFVPVGADPPLQSFNGHIRELDADFGESIFHPNRDTNEKNNLLMSILLEHAARSREQPLKVFSADGSKTLDENPHEAGSEISLQKDTEDIQILEPTRAAVEVGPLLSLISGEQQRGSLPFTAYGELQFQLSGFAIGQLRQGIDTVLQPPLRATELFYLQALRLIKDQYLTDKFDTMQLSGMDRDRQYFNQQITPEHVREAGDLEVRLAARLPQDDPAKFGMAQIAREGPTPLLPDEFIWEDILEIQDSDQLEDAIKEQIGERGLPAAGLWEMVQAMFRQGRPDLAQLYLMQFMMLQQQQLGQMQQLRQQFMGGPGGPGGPGAGPGGPGGPGPGGPGPGGPGPGGPAGAGFAPQVLPMAAQGAPPPVPTPQAGPNVPPGSPRPGARLVGPTGQPLL